jgi:ligand-binding sensor domain-containing protein
MPLRIPVSVLLCAAALLSRGQSPQFQHIGHRQGLVFNEIHCMARDHAGTLWIGTAMGLSRYDGAGFRTFTVHDGLPSPRIRQMKVDQEGMLWLATSKGLAKLDPRTLQVRSWHLDSTGTMALRYDHLWNVLPLADGRVICAAIGRTWLFDPGTNDRKVISDPSFGEIVHQGHVLLPDSAGTGCWISTVNGLVYINALNGRVHHAGNSGHPLLQGLKVNAMFRDADGSFWMDDLTTGGLMHYRPANGHLQKWPHLPGDPKIRFPSGLITIHKDRRGKLWMGGWDLNMVVFDPLDSSAVILRHDPEDPTAVPNQLMAALVEDEQGVIWIGTHSGLAVHDPRSLHYSIQRPVDEVKVPGMLAVNSMYKTTTGHTYYATWNGLVAYDPSNGNYQHIAVEHEGYSNAVVEMKEREGLLWLATFDGLRAFDPVNGRQVATGLPDTSLLSHGQLQWLMKDTEGKLWTWVRRHGLHTFDPATGVTTRLPDDTNGKSGPLPGGIICAIQASDGRIWLGHEQSGLSWYDPATREFSSLHNDVIGGRLSSGRILALAEDGQGRIWGIADGAGVFSYDNSTRQYKVYDERHGLSVPAGSSILPDAKGRLWIGTLKGLALFDPQRERFVTMMIDAGGGSPHDDVGKCAYRDAGGRFHFSVDHAMIDFDPLSYDLPAPPAKPVIQTLYVGTGEDQVTGIEAGRRIILDHTQDRLSIRFATFDVPGRIVRYAIRELADSIWHDGPEEQISIGRLEPGSYHFQLRTMAADGQWSPPTDLLIEVTPPWWRRPIYRAGFAVLFAGLVVLLFRLRLDLIRRRERRQEAFSRTVNELRLRALRAQMDPHFVFNCMNSIDRYIVMNEPEKASRYLNRFAKLVRLILHQSDHVTVPLEKEVEMLNYYLELESLRFEEPFSFEVITDPLLEREEPEIPAMLVQPYVENAIWHGLQHRKGRGHVKVEFRKLGDSMVVTVEDDGIGRDEAARIKAQRTTVHSSKGMQVNADRLSLLKELELEGSSVVIDDLVDREGKALGTRVTITLPLEALHEDAWMEKEE